jgi:hypothetical protein
VIRSYQEDFGKDGANRKVMGIVLNVPNGIAVGDRPGVESSVISTRPPTVIFLGHDM